MLPGRRQHDPVLWMAHACTCLRARELFLAQRNFWLIPELDPLVVDTIIKLEVLATAGCMLKSSSWMILRIVSF